MCFDDAIISDQRAWKQAWRATPRKMRRKIALAVYNGQALTEPAEAALAVGFARKMLRPDRVILGTLFNRVGSGGEAGWISNVRHARRLNYDTAMVHR